MACPQHDTVSSENHVHNLLLQYWDACPLSITPVLRVIKTKSSTVTAGHPDLDRGHVASGIYWQHVPGRCRGGSFPDPCLRMCSVPTLSFKENGGDTTKYSQNTYCILTTKGCTMLTCRSVPGQSPQVMVSTGGRPAGTQHSVQRQISHGKLSLFQPTSTITAALDLKLLIASHCRLWNKWKRR